MTDATAGTTMGSTGKIRSSFMRAGSREAAHARSVPRTRAMASEPRASPTVALIVSATPLRS